MSALLKLNNIRKTFAELTVLENISLTLAPGEIVSLLGPSGCGKSTLLRIAAGLDNQFEGDLERNPLFEFGQHSGIGVVFQEPRLMPWLNVAENIGFVDGWKANQRWTQQLLKDVGLEERGDALPKELSGGMAQRVAIARGLYGNPKVLLLDEPFSAVDAFTRMRLQDLVISLIRQYEISILLVTHDLDEAIYLSDRVIILGGQPSRIVSEIKVPVAHPRDRRAASLAYLRGEALSALYQHQTLDTTIQPTPHTTPQGH
jgi:sulfonate transport system ATP-binding protein